MSADFSVFSLSHGSIECFFSDVLFKFTSWKEEGEAVAPETHCQLYHETPETARSCCFGVFALHIAAEGCLHSHYPVVWVFFFLLWIHKMNGWLRSVSNSVSSGVTRVTPLQLDRRSHFLSFLKMR